MTLLQILLMDYSESWVIRVQSISFCRFLLVPMMIFSLQMTAFCQKKEEKAPVCFVNFAVLVNYSSVIDQKFSSLSWSGTNPGLSLRLKMSFPHIEHVIEAVYSGGNLRTSEQETKKLATNSLSIDYYNLIPVYKSENELFTFQAGAGLEFLYGNRTYNDFINSGQSFETILSAAGTGRLEYIFGSDIHSFRISDHFTFPFLFYYSQPGYSGLTENASESGSVRNENQIVFMPEIFRFINMVALEKPLGSSLAVSVFYNWDFYRINSPTELRNNNQQLGLSVRYKF